MNPATSGKSSTRSSGYHQKALQEIRNSLLPFANIGGIGETVGSSAASTISTLSTTSGVSSASGLSGLSAASGNNSEKDLSVLRQAVSQLVTMGYTEEASLRALKLSGGRLEAALDLLSKQQHAEPINGITKGPSPGLSALSTKLIRKPSLERELAGPHRGSPALDSGAGSSRSDSPGQGHPHPQLSRQYSPSAFAAAAAAAAAAATEPPPPTPPIAAVSSVPPPVPPPRCSSTPPPVPPPPPHHVQQLLKRMSPAPVPVVPSRPPPQPPCQVSVSVPVVTPSAPSSTRGTSPTLVTPSRPQPMVVQNGPQVQQQLSQQMQALNLYPSSSAGSSGGPSVSAAGGSSGGSSSLSSEPPPPYPLVPPSPTVPPPPPSYTVSIQSRQSPTQSQQEYRKSPSSGIYSGPGSAGSPSPVTVSVSSPPPSASSVARPTPLLAWSARQAKTQPPIIMQSVKSTQVQKPVLQTAIAPTAPPPTAQPPTQSQPPPPSYALSVQQKQQHAVVAAQKQTPPPVPVQQSSVGSVTPSQVSVPTTDPPSYAITMQALAASRGHHHHPLPPPPYGPLPGADDGVVASGAQVSTVESAATPRPSPAVQQAAGHSHHPPLQRKFSPAVPDGVVRADSPGSVQVNDCRPSPQPPLPAYPSENPQQTPPLPPTTSSSVANKNKGSQANSQNGGERRSGPAPPPYKIDHQSPIPERKHISKEKEEERRDCKVRNYSPQAFKFFMEQHVENVLKSHKQRLVRRMQLETEMSKIGLSAEAQCQMRKMLSQKESNYIRLKRAKMDKSMFTKIKPIGVGAFGEVALVRKIDTHHLYAMKTLRKADVLKRNQVAHVKAERDILAEADNEWVVKLYYSFQDKDNLYFVMDYIPGGDLMSLLIKLGIFEEPLARFYIAELTCAVESVHKMGFIHRDIKPDNILIDRDGHIKLTDFGLCTGFRWTHNSKYYQRNGEHGRQDSMDPAEDWNNSECRCHQLKPLERRRRREHQRCLAHSLVGTPNYIAPEVLLRTGYTQLCDWWSVGVILYEMLVGSPPFLAGTPAETQYKVIHWETTLHIPKAANLSPESKDLILKLCTSADRRLGRSASDIKSHPFFTGIDFEKGLRRHVPPHIPKIHYPTDTSNFDPVDPERLRNSGSSGSDKSEDYSDSGRPFHGFFEFTFRRFFDDGGGPSYSRISLDENDNQGPVYV